MAYGLCKGRFLIDDDGSLLLCDLRIVELVEDNGVDVETALEFVVDTEDLCMFVVLATCWNCLRHGSII